MERLNRPAQQLWNGRWKSGRLMDTRRGQLWKCSYRAVRRDPTGGMYRRAPRAHEWSSWSIQLLAHQRDHRAERNHMAKLLGVARMGSGRSLFGHDGSRAEQLPVDRAPPAPGW